MRNLKWTQALVILAALVIAGVLVKVIPGMLF